MKNFNHGHVICGPKGEYLVDQGYKYLDSQAMYAREMKQIQEFKTLPEYGKNVYDQVDASLGDHFWAGFRKDLDAWARLRETRNRKGDIVIPASFVAEVYKPGQPKKCDPEYSAKTVEAAYKEAGSSVAEKVARMRSHDYGADDRCDRYNDHGQCVMNSAKPALVSPRSGGTSQRAQ